MYTNINITNNSDQFKYIVEYLPNKWDKKHNVNYLNNIEIQNNFIESILFTYDNNKCIKYNNHWYNIDENIEGIKNEFMPSNPKLNTIRLYFPTFSVDTYHTGHKYALTINTWICGKCVILGTYIINRYDSCAIYKEFFNNKYFEFIDLPILDPLDLIYSDEWSLWRQQICGESTIPSIINTEGTILNCSLYPIASTEEGYIKLSEYDGGQNHINFNNSNQSLVLNISTNLSKSLDKDERPAILFNIDFNKYYDKSLKEYLNETYGLTNCKIKYDLIIGNKDDIYTFIESDLLDLVNTYKFEKDEICKNNFDNGNGWVSGIYIVGSANIINEDNESMLYLLSNKINFTEDILKYFTKSEFINSKNKIINNVKLNDVNMNLININAVNKTENKIIKVDNIGDSRGNIYQTVFYRVSDLSDIVIRPAINENICINLDMYKHLVKSFIIQIEGIKFIEIGRNKSGIIFKVIGNRLPKKINTGQYYILNQDSEMISSGKYTYVI